MADSFNFVPPNVSKSGIETRKSSSIIVIQELSLNRISGLSDSECELNSEVLDSENNDNNNNNNSNNNNIKMCRCCSCIYASTVESLCQQQSEDTRFSSSYKPIGQDTPQMDMKLNPQHSQHHDPTSFLKNQLHNQSHEGGDIGIQSECVSPCGSLHGSQTQTGASRPQIRTISDTGLACECGRQISIDNLLNVHTLHPLDKNDIPTTSECPFVSSGWPTNVARQLAVLFEKKSDIQDMLIKERGGDQANIPNSQSYISLVDDKPSDGYTNKNFIDSQLARLDARERQSKVNQRETEVVRESFSQLSPSENLHPQRKVLPGHQVSLNYYDSQVVKPEILIDSVEGQKANLSRRMKEALSLRDECRGNTGSNSLLPSRAGLLPVNSQVLPTFSSRRSSNLSVSAMQASANSNDPFPLVKSDYSETLGSFESALLGSVFGLDCAASAPGELIHNQFTDNSFICGISNSRGSDYCVRKSDQDSTSSRVGSMSGLVLSFKEALEKTPSPAGTSYDVTPSFTHRSAAPWKESPTESFPQSYGVGHVSAFEIRDKKKRDKDFTQKLDLNFSNQQQQQQQQPLSKINPCSLHTQPISALEVSTVLSAGHTKRSSTTLRQYPQIVPISSVASSGVSSPLSASQSLPVPCPPPVREQDGHVLKVQQRLQFYKTRLCPHFFSKNGYCRRGQDCNYAHSKTELKSSVNLNKTKLCQSFLSGGCTKSIGICPFAHGVAELRSTPSFYKSEICKYWIAGSCPAGDSCRHAHGEMERSSGLLREVSCSIDRQNVDVANVMPSATSAVNCFTKNFNTNNPNNNIGSSVTYFENPHKGFNEVACDTGKAVSGTANRSSPPYRDFYTLTDETRFPIYDINFPTAPNPDVLGDTSSHNDRPYQSRLYNNNFNTINYNNNNKNNNETFVPHNPVPWSHSLTSGSHSGVGQPDATNVTSMAREAVETSIKSRNLGAGLPLSSLTDDGLVASLDSTTLLNNETCQSLELRPFLSAQQQSLKTEGKPRLPRLDLQPISISSAVLDSTRFPPSDDAQLPPNPFVETSSNSNAKITSESRFSRSSSLDAPLNEAITAPPPPNSYHSTSYMLSENFARQKNSLTLPKTSFTPRSWRSSDTNLSSDRRTQSGQRSSCSPHSTSRRGSVIPSRISALPDKHESSVGSATTLTDILRLQQFIKDVSVTPLPSSKEALLSDSIVSFVQGNISSSQCGSSPNEVSSFPTYRSYHSSLSESSPDKCDQLSFYSIPTDNNLPNVMTKQCPLASEMIGTNSNNLNPPLLSVDCPGEPTLSEDQKGESDLLKLIVKKTCEIMGAFSQQPHITELVTADMLGTEFSSTNVMSADSFAANRPPVAREGVLHSTSSDVAKLRSSGHGANSLLNHSRLDFLEQRKFPQHEDIFPTLPFNVSGAHQSNFCASPTGLYRASGLAASQHCDLIECPVFFTSDSGGSGPPKDLEGHSEEHPHSTTNFVNNNNNVTLPAKITNSSSADMLTKDLIKAVFDNKV